jgi:hypothetical protein
MPDINIEEMRAEMRRAVRYRSGPDLMNTVYLGGMAAAGIVSKLGGRYGTDGLDDLIVNASEAQIQSAWDYDGFQWILKHYREAGSKLYEFEIVRREIE